MTDRSAALSILRGAVSDEIADFRPGQWEAIDALVNRRERLLLVQRTGWGKSAVYFIATRLLRTRGSGPTLIISPLLALIRNQIAAAARYGVKALTINSANYDDWPAVWKDIREDKADVLLISPERLANDDFVERIMRPPVTTNVPLFVVDEAHCISEWGHDFRPDYRRLVGILQRMPSNMPILGTTATANDHVDADIRRQLGDIHIQRGPLRRGSLALDAMRMGRARERLDWIVGNINKLPGTGIIYALTKEDAKNIERHLRKKGIAVCAYYSDVAHPAFSSSDAYRMHIEDQLLNNELKAVVSTIALGIGFDKPDLGFVVHYQAPSSVVSYYQQVGRAGRRLDHAVGVLMAGNEDEEIHDYFRETQFPTQKSVNEILAVLETSDGMTVTEMENVVNERGSKIAKALQYIAVERPAPVIRVGSRWRRTAVSYTLDHEKIQRIRRRREAEWREMLEYIDSKGCLMQFLTDALNDAERGTCGKCARCLGPGQRLLQSPATEPRPSTGRSHAEPPTAVSGFEVPLDCNTDVPENAFQAYPFRNEMPVVLRAGTGRVLSGWRDLDWAGAVDEDKNDGHFRDTLVEAAAEMVKCRWMPQPSPEWVTCVPSMRRPGLVPDFASRVAFALRLPFRPIVVQDRVNLTQGEQKNDFHRCRNIDGVFSVCTDPPDGPVLLVDDVVGSGWTMAVVAALLRKAGSGLVWPLALATARKKA